MNVILSDILIDSILSNAYTQFTHFVLLPSNLSSAVHQQLQIIKIKNNKYGNEKGKEMFPNLKLKFKLKFKLKLMFNGSMKKLR